MTYESNIRSLSATLPIGHAVPADAGNIQAAVADITESSVTEALELLLGLADAALGAPALRNADHVLAP